MENKCQYVNGKWTFCGHHYIGAEILSINGNIKVFCRGCNTDLTGVVVEQNNGHCPGSIHKNVECIIAIHNRNVKSGRPETHMHKNSLTEEEAEIMRKDGYKVSLWRGVWVIE
jgi:hypothetical protein